MTGPRSQRNAMAKALQLLKAILEDPREGWGVRELAERLGMPPSTVHRLLVALEAQGLLERNPRTAQYHVGLELYRMMLLAQSQFAVRNLALPIMRDLVREWDETSFLGLYDALRMEMVFAAAVESSKPLRYVVPLNQWIPVYCAASGFAIMAFLPEDEIERIIEHTGLRPETDRTITDPQTLRQELQRVREEGYSCTHGERVVGAVGFAAPIWGPDQRVIGDLNLSIPEQRFETNMEPKVAERVIYHAQRVTERLSAHAAARRKV